MKTSETCNFAWRIRYFLWPAVICVLLGASASAVTIISVAGPNFSDLGLISQESCNAQPTIFCPPQAVAAAWSQTSTYNNVAITVQFALYGNSLSGIAYLMRQVGPGTTLAEQVASATFAVQDSSPDASSNASTPWTVLSIPSLGPGSYYLVIVPTGTCSNSPFPSTCGVGNWMTTNSPTVITDAGVSDLGIGSTYPNSFASYVPATPFTGSLGVSGTGGLEFQVTGDVTASGCRAPTITDLNASPNILWPPNHKMVRVNVIGNTSGGCGAVSCQITNVSSNEPLDADGDWQITGSLTLNLRAERLGKGSGRIYTITVQCADSQGNSATKTTAVVVPHDQGK